MWQFGWLLPSGGSTEPGDVPIHGSDKHDDSVLKEINPNLIYNSTGMMNTHGWEHTPRTINFRDNFMIDDFSYFVTKGNDEGTGMTCISIPVQSGGIYTFSGYFDSVSNIRITVLYQKDEHLNTLEAHSREIIYDAPSTLDMRVIRQLHIPEGISGAAFCIEHLAASEEEEAIIKRLKLEEGDVATKWIPCMTDPYLNQIRLSSVNASDI
jgi:hypothetical protein